MKKNLSVIGIVEEDTRHILIHNKSNIQQANSQHQTKGKETQSNPTEIGNRKCWLLSPYLST